MLDSSISKRLTPFRDKERNRPGTKEDSGLLKNTKDKSIVQKSPPMNPMNCVFQTPTDKTDPHKNLDLLSQSTLHGGTTRRPITVGLT
ncbi:hypothetical protein V6N11_052656 [Hibiscus sabdariffa]|uniref:Uncharacterized protein n=1 Tax=Hibiscus sabdariffa TaxID=183260 RepID=A0ABR2UB07_9ROSI